MAFGVKTNERPGTRAEVRYVRMWEFFDRLISIAIPRVRDFRGLPVTFDGHGNYTFGVNEQLIFPEIDYDRIDATRGMAGAGQVVLDKWTVNAVLGVTRELVGFHEETPLVAKQRRLDDQDFRKRCRNDVHLVPTEQHFRLNKYQIYPTRAI